MASPAVPVTLVGKLAARRHQAAGSGRRVLPILAWVAALCSRAADGAREHGPTFAAFAAIDMGCWQASSVAGWIAAGLSVLFLDWKIRD